MFKTLIGFTQFNFAANIGINLQLTRNTFILKRRYPVRLHKNGDKPPKLKSRDFHYELVVDQSVLPSKNLSIILTQYSKGLGNRGDVVEMKSNFAYNWFLLPGLAVYNTPKNAERYPKTKVGELDHFSSPFVEKSITNMREIVLNISMNKSHPWSLEPWHIKAAFRMHGCHVPEYSIEMPPGEISGPDESLQNKEFFVTVTLNGVEKVNVVCRINHWSYEKVPMPELSNYEPLFMEQAEILSKLQATRLEAS